MRPASCFRCHQCLSSSSGHHLSKHLRKIPSPQCMLCPLNNMPQWISRWMYHPCQALPPSSVYISGQCAYHCCSMWAKSHCSSENRKQPGWGAEGLICPHPVSHGARPGWIPTGEAHFRPSIPSSTKLQKETCSCPGWRETFVLPGWEWKGRGTRNGHFLLSRRPWKFQHRPPNMTLFTHVDIHTVGILCYVSHCISFFLKP